MSQDTLTDHNIPKGENGETHGMRVQPVKETPNHGCLGDTIKQRDGYGPSDQFGLSESNAQSRRNQMEKGCHKDEFGGVLIDTGIVPVQGVSQQEPVDGTTQ